MRKNLWLSLVVISVCALAADYTNINRVQAGGSTAKQLKVETLVSTKIPLNFGPATVTNVDDKQVLTYSVNNLSNERLTNIQVAFFILDLTGQVRGGEGWARDINLFAGSTEEFAFTLKNSVTPTDRLVLAVSKVSGPTKTFEVEPAELIKAVKSPFVSGNHKLNATSLIKVMTQTGGASSYCSNALKTAQGACKCGVQSFSCNENTGYSFTCFSPDSCRAPLAPQDNGE